MTAPFEVGDKVIRIGRTIVEKNLYKDQIYTIRDVWLCCPQAGYRVSVEEAGDPGSGRQLSNWICNDGQHDINRTGWYAKDFVKVQEGLSEYTIESLLEELIPVEQKVFV